MLIISIPHNDIPRLDADGCTVKINGQQTVLRREGDYLCYGEKRCKLLEAVVTEDLVQFVAASHGQEHEPHVIIRPSDGSERAGAARGGRG